MTSLYPEIEPFDHGLLDVGESNTIYWETCGNPGGKSVVVLHGGPGSGCTPHWRRFFDPTAYRIVLFDLRGCGRSRPYASELTTDLSVNTTWHLLADMERLRWHLGIDRWMLFGGSWSSTLALAYAEEYPQLVSALILWGVAMARRTEINWLYRDVAPLFPEEWSRFVAGVVLATWYIRSEKGTARSDRPSRKRGVHVRRERAWLLEGGMVYCSARVLPVSSGCFRPEDGRLGGTEHISAPCRLGTSLRNVAACPASALP